MERKHNMSSTINYNNVLYKIIQTTKEISVEATLPKRITVRDPKIRCNISHVKEMLEKEGIRIGAPIDTPTRPLTNSRNKDLNGRWVFEKPKTAKKNIR